MSTCIEGRPDPSRRARRLRGKALAMPNARRQAVHGAAWALPTEDLELDASHLTDPTSLVAGREMGSAC